MSTHQAEPDYGQETIDQVNALLQKEGSMPELVSTMVVLATKTKDAEVATEAFRQVCRLFAVGLFHEDPDTEADSLPALLVSEKILKLFLHMVLVNPDQDQNGDAALGSSHGFTTDLS